MKASPRTKALKKALIDKDLTSSELAEKIGVSKQMMSAVINGRARTPWIRRKVAELLDTTYLKLWGTQDPGTDHERRVGTHQVDLSTHSTTHATVGGGR